jgi:SAM-dependent methyltransferase
MTAALDLLDRELGATPRPGSSRTRRPALRLSDLWRAPIHDFPIRDEILYQYLPLSEDADVLEIGPGSGFTAYRLARAVRRLTLVEAAPEVVAQLGVDLKHVPNVRLLCADLSQPGLEERLEGDVGAAFGLDVFEYVADPARCLCNLATVLRPGGRLLLSFPNVPPPLGDGVTFFSRIEDLEDLLSRAGFRDWSISVVRMRPRPGNLYALLHEWPLTVLRRLRTRPRDPRPQTYQRTWAFQHRRALLPLKIALHALWRVLGALMRRRGQVFDTESPAAGILGNQLLVVATR